MALDLDRFAQRLRQNISALRVAGSPAMSLRSLRDSTSQSALRRMGTAEWESGTAAGRSSPLQRAARNLFLRPNRNNKDRRLGVIGACISMHAALLSHPESLESSSLSPGVVLCPETERGRHT